jgi:hypothetical protein
VICARVRVHVSVFVFVCAYGVVCCVGVCVCARVCCVGVCVCVGGGGANRTTVQRRYRASGPIHARRSFTHETLTIHDNGKKSACNALVVGAQQGKKSACNALVVGAQKI